MKKPKRLRNNVLSEVFQKKALERLKKIVKILQPFEDRTGHVSCNHLHMIYKLAKGQ